MESFTHWSKWQVRTNLPGLKYPGVYAIALSKNDISGKSFSWRSEIIYIGMTNSKGGLKSRLRQFDYTIKNKKGKKHSGAVRVRCKYPNYESLIGMLYVSVCPHKCNVLSNAPADFRIMGDVAKLEYECFATFTEHFRKLPGFNDKKGSPKDHPK